MSLLGQILGLILAFAAGLAAAGLRRRRRGPSSPGPRAVLLENLEDPWVILDREDRVIDLNSAAARSLGTTETAARGGLGVQVLSSWPAVLSRSAPSEVLLNGLAYDLSILPFSGGRILRLRAAADRKRLEDDLRRARQSAELAGRTTSQFLAMMSHEIRTPLNGVVGFTELLQDTPLNAEQLEFVRLAVQSGRSLLVIIDDLLDYSRIEAGQLVLDSASIDLPALVGTTLDLWQPGADAKGIQLSWSIDPAAPARIRGDPTRLAQILNNLVGNAIKFTPQGGVTVRLSGHVVSAVTPPVAILTCEVADTGIGIAPDALARLSHPFAQADLSATRSYGGAGLGLAITRRLCELMGGRLQAVSEPGKGSIFTATLHSPIDEMALPQPEAVIPVHPGRGLKILACEDNEINRRLLEALLVRRGHHVDFAEDGVAGLERLAATEYDLIFVDLAMPRMDGREFVRHVRKQEAERGEPARHLIALTASAMKGERERCLAAGMDDFLPKPIDQPALDQALAGFGARLASGRFPE
jgi:signal transduction histidine kinase/ActR/RegA family two-component response regulator